jgi:DUF2892 family protein
MPMHYAIRLVAGTFVLVSLALGQWVSPWWYLFTAFVGLNLVQSSLTHWCLMEKILARLGLARPDLAGLRVRDGAGLNRAESGAGRPSSRAA